MFQTGMIKRTMCLPTNSFKTSHVKETVPESNEHRIFDNLRVVDEIDDVHSIESNSTNDDDQSDQVDTSSETTPDTNSDYDMNDNDEYEQIPNNNILPMMQFAMIMMEHMYLFNAL